MSETADARAGDSCARRSLGPETWIWCLATLAVAIAFGRLGSKTSSEVGSRAVTCAPPPRGEQQRSATGAQSAGHCREEHSAS